MVYTIFNLNHVILIFIAQLYVYVSYTSKMMYITVYFQFINSLFFLDRVCQFRKMNQSLLRDIYFDGSSHPFEIQLQ